MTQQLDVVGVPEIVTRAAQEFRAEISINTARSWVKRHRAWVEAGRKDRAESRPWEEPIPDPEWTVNNGPAWKWADIRAWLLRTGKVTAPES